MPNEETQAASSPDVFEGKEVSMAEYSHYRSSGELPERFQPPAESAPAATQEETEQPEGDEPESVPESDPEETQEPKGSGAEKRIKQLLAKTKELERQLAAKQDGKTESSPAPAPKSANPKPTADDTNPDGTLKYASYEDVVEAIGRWAAKEERATWEREHAENEARKALQTKLEDARSRYDDADDVIFPTGKAIHEAQMPPVVRAVFEDSEHFLDLCYVVGSDPDALNKFISLAQTNPRAAIAKVFDYERAIKDELKPKDAPEPKRTNAPKPPSPVGGATSRGFDVNDESSSPDEWMRKRNQELARKGG